MHNRNDRNHIENGLLGWLVSLLMPGRILHFMAARPGDSFAGIVVLLAAGMVIVNALFLQPGLHPMPIFSVRLFPETAGGAIGAFGGVNGGKNVVMIRNSDYAVERKSGTERIEAASQDLQRVTYGPTLATSPASDGVRKNDPIADIIAPSRQVKAVQRALSEFGYGQITPTGHFDIQTKLAIKQFERERHLPVTGDISERLIRELSARIRRPLE